MSALIIHDVPIECINSAATTYHVPATLIISVLKTEGGKNGMASKNKDGTYDYGPMQINTCWLDKVARYGYTKQDLQHNPCANVAVGAWILASGIAESKTVWNGVGNYHSHTPHLNARYNSKVQKYHNWLNNIIDGKEGTHNRGKTTPKKITAADHKSNEDQQPLSTYLTF